MLPLRGLTKFVIVISILVAGHSWITIGLTEDLDGGGDQYFRDASAVSPGTYYVWDMISDAVNTGAYYLAHERVTIPNVVPSISSLNPTSGPKNRWVDINGSNFGSSRGTNGRVDFGGVYITTSVISWTDTKIVVAVPSSLTTGNKTVTVRNDGGQTSNGVTFSVGDDPLAIITNSPELLCPSAATVGQPFDVTATLRNGHSGAAQHGGLSFSFPGFTLQDVDMATGGPYETVQAKVETILADGTTVSYFDQGDSIDRGGTPGSAQHLLVDSDYTNWTYGAERDLALRITPGQSMAGQTMRIRLRGALAWGGQYGWDLKSRDPNSGGTGIESDQQYYQAYYCDVSVLSPGDTYEPDNTFTQAKTITSGSQQTRSINPAGDDDWIKLTLSQTSNVTVETSGPSGDTEMWLYASNGTTEIDHDDDDGTGSFSLISQNGLASGTYYILVRAYGDNSTIGTYYLSLTTSVPPVPSISSLNPTSGPKNRWVDINGSNFGSSRGTNGRVDFGGVYITTSVISWTDTKIVVAVPSSLTTGNKTVTVRNDGGQTSNGVTFSVGDDPLAIITNSPELLCPSAATVGQPFDVTATLRNGHSGAAQHGGLSFSFPGFTLQDVDMATGGPYETVQAKVETILADGTTVSYFDQGDSIDRGGTPGSAQHLLVDSDYTNWTYGAERDLTLRITPGQSMAGQTMRIRLRGALAWGGQYGWDLKSRDPNLGGTGIESDQQYYQAYYCDVSILAFQVSVTVRNVTGAPQQDAVVKRYADSGTYIDQQTTGLSGVATFSNVPNGTYKLKAYYTPTGQTPAATELWGSVQAIVNGEDVAKEILRAWPTIAVNDPAPIVVPSSIAAGQSASIQIKVYAARGGSYPTAGQDDFGSE